MAYRIEDIEALLAVVEARSVSAAALRLGVAKSVVSERVAALEAALGATLLHRSRRGVTPTDRGMDFYRRAREILGELDAAAEAVTEREGAALSGLVRIAGPMSFGIRWLGPALFPLLREHPALSVALDLDDHCVDLLAAGYDLAIRVGRLTDSSMVARRLGRCGMVICASPDYVRRHGRPATLEALAEHESVGYALVPAGQAWLFEPKQKGGEPRSVTMRCRLLINNGDAMRDAAAAGLGLAILPRFIAIDALRGGTLVDAAPELRPLPSGVWAVYPQSRHPSRKVRTIVEHLRRQFADGAPWEDLSSG
jgi:DNA-binding transcriptional LysR family regulator